MCDNTLWSKRLQVLRNCGNCAEEGCVARTTKVVQDVLQCKAAEARRRRSDGFKVEEVGRTEGLSRVAVGSIWHGAIRAQSVGTCHHQRSLDPVLATAESVRQNGTGGRWQHETPYKEELELGRHSNYLCFEGVLIRRADYAGKSGDCVIYLEQFLGNGKLGMWASTEYCTGYVEEEHGLREADHCTSLRTGRDHFVVRVSSLSLFPA